MNSLIGLTDVGEVVQSLYSDCNTQNNVAIERHITEWLIFSTNVQTPMLKTISGRKVYINSGTKNSTPTSRENRNWKLIRPLTA